MNKKSISKTIISEIDEMGKIKRKLESSIQKAPQGHIRCSKRGNGFQYFIGNKYLNKTNGKLIKDIVNREYQEKLLPKIDKKIKMLERFKNIIEYDFDEVEETYKSLSEARRRYVNPIIRIKSEYIREWQEAEYDHWEITDNDVKGNFITVKGERVRSKSEKIIADELTRFGIPYRYEYPLQLNDNGRIVTKRPDFIALNPGTLKSYIIEHLGIMDMDRYYQNSISKIDLYERNGYLLGREILIFHETSDRPLNTQVVDKYIEEYLI